MATMYNLPERTITLRGKEHPILAFEVWFQTPVGLFANVEDASKHLQGMDFDPRLCMVPVTVAIAADGIYEVMSK
jgi:hypothetical protein